MNSHIEYLYIIQISLFVCINEFMCHPILFHSHQHTVVHHSAHYMTLILDLHHNSFHFVFHVFYNYSNILPNIPMYTLLILLMLDQQHTQILFQIFPQNYTRVYMELP